MPAAVAILEAHVRDKFQQAHADSLRLEIDRAVYQKNLPDKLLSRILGPFADEPELLMARRVFAEAVAGSNDAAARPLPSLSPSEPISATETGGNRRLDFMARVEATQAWRELGEQPFGKQAQQFIGFGIRKYGAEMYPSVGNWAKAFEAQFQKGCLRSARNWLDAGVEAGVLIRTPLAGRKTRMYAIDPAIFDD